MPLAQSDRDGIIEEARRQVRALRENLLAHGLSPGGVTDFPAGERTHVPARARVHSLSSYTPEGRVLKSGDVLDLRPLGAKFFIKKTAAETDGRSFDMEWELAPRTGGTPVHVHPRATETYEVLEGELELYVDGNWRTLSAGEQLTVPPGVPHTFRNASANVTRVYNTHQPAMRYAEYFEGLDLIARRGIFSAQKMTFQAILHLAVLMTTFRDEIVSVKPPDPVMRFLGRVGRLLGYQVQSSGSRDTGRAARS